jgi:hypothetical protein
MRLNRQKNNRELKKDARKTSQYLRLITSAAQ